MAETSTGFNIAELITGIERGRVTIEDKGAFENEENDVRSIKITGCKNTVTNVYVYSTKSSPAQLKLVFYKGKTFLEKKELSYAFLNKTNNENYKKLVKAIINNNLRKDAKTKDMGRVLAETAILVDQDTESEIKIFHTRLGKGITQSTFKEDLAVVVKNAKESRKPTAHILVSCRGTEEIDEEIAGHTICLSVNTDRFNEDGELNSGEKLKFGDYLITDGSGVSFNWFKDQQEFKDIRDMMDLPTLRYQTYTFDSNSIQNEGRCSEFAGCAYQILSDDKYSDLSLSNLIEKKKELACDIACKIERNHIQAARKMQEQENISIKKLGDSEKDSISVPEGYAKINFEKSSCYLIKCRSRPDEDPVGGNFNIKNLLKVIGGNNLIKGANRISKGQISNLTYTVYIDGRTEIVELGQCEQIESQPLTPRPEGANMMNQDNNQRLLEVIPEESLESSEGSVKSRPQVKPNQSETSPVIEALNFKKLLTENFSEKANHGQGVLTGGVLLNLGVSRDQLRKIVNNRDKPIEINVEEPVPPSNRSFGTKVKVERKEIGTEERSQSPANTELSQQETVKRSLRGKSALAVFKGCSAKGATVIQKPNSTKMRVKSSVTTNRPPFNNNPESAEEKWNREHSRDQRRNYSVHREDTEKLRITTVERPRESRKKSNSKRSNLPPLS